MKKIIAFIFIISLSLSCNPFKKEEDKNKGLSFQGGLEVLKKSFDYYKTTMTEEEFVFDWLILFKDYRYIMDGNLKDQGADCLSAYWFFMHKHGANIPLEGMPEMQNRIKKLSELNQIKVYKDYGKILNGGYNSVRRGDIIIWHRPQLKVPYHIGIIYSKNNGYIQYMEMEGIVGKSNFAYTRFDHPDISMVFSISYSYWIGSMFSVEEK